jgi:hypothetical protein
MKIINIHTRTINQAKSKIAEIFGTLSSKNDQILATEKWSPMILDAGLKIGSKGGHGPIRYTVLDYQKGDFIVFGFSKPKGFNGFH